MELEFYYDVVCPYAYVASQRIEAVAARTGATLRWRPVLLGGLFKHVGASQNPGADMNPNKARLNLLDMHRQAERAGVTLKMHPQHPVRSVEAMRLLTGAPEAVRPALTHALYRAYWVDTLRIDDVDVLQRIGAAHGVDAAAILADPAVKQRLRDTTAEAAGQGAFGVPAMVVDGRLYWGADRLHFVEAALGGTPPTQPATGAGGRVEFFHDFSSPYSYLAATQIARVASAHGAELVWRPMLLGGLFHAVGTATVPLLAMNAARQAYMGRDLDDWARWWGVPFTFNDTFPLRTVAALRVALQAPEATAALYQAAWVDRRDIGQPEVLAAVLTEAGHDAEALLRGTADPAIKAQLRANTEAAAAAGACGAPTFLVHGPGQAEPVLFWGQDRLDQVAAVLDGWQPAFA